MRIRNLLSNNRGEVNAGSDADVDYEAIAKEAYEEVDAQREGREPKKVAKPEEEDADKGTPEDQEEEQDIEKTEDDQTGEEEDKPEEESEPEPETEKSEEEDPDQDKLITDYAQKHSMTYAEAKEDMEKTDKIIEQFKNDPKEMARALRNKDREYDKLKNELSKKEQAKPVFQRATEDQFRNSFRTRVEADPEKYLEGYRKRYPAKSEYMSDEAIVEEILDREWLVYQGWEKEKESEIKTLAQQKRDEFLNSFKEEDRKFLPDVKAMVLSAEDRYVVTEKWQPEILLQIAKGKRYDQDIKAAQEEAIKRAKENPKILGVKTGGKQAPSKAHGSTSLNPNQKQRAIEMFGDDYDESKCYEMYKDLYKDELKQNPSFV